jgi:uncharacterized repeat protein (TIGR01451 family)
MNVVCPKEGTMRFFDLRAVVVCLFLFCALLVCGTPTFAQTTYTSDDNIAHFTSNISQYAQLSSFAAGDTGSPFTPTSAELAANGFRVYGGTLFANNQNGLASGNNWILATFSSPVSNIVVFPNIDHFGAQYDGYQYTIAGSNDCETWTVLFDATSVNGDGEPFTLGNFTGTAPTTVNNVLTPGAGPGGTVGYIATFNFGTAYSCYALGASTVAFNQGNADQELSAVGTTVTTITQPGTNATQPGGATYTFNGADGQTVAQVVDLSKSNVTVDGVNISVTDTPIKPADFAKLVANTSFAVDQCFIMQGELDNLGNPACKEYQILCTTASNSVPAGSNCPVSQARNEFYSAVFNPAASSILVATGAGKNLPPYLGNPTGVAYPMATDDWTGGPCVFPAADTNMANDLCPQNFLTNFTSVGDPSYSSTITTKNPNSTVIPTYNHPLQQTTPTVVGQNAAGWNTSNTVTVNFATQAPFFGSPAPNNFVPAQVAGVTYWTDETANDTNTPPADAKQANQVAMPPLVCPAPSTTATPPAMALPPFVTTATLNLGDGVHTLGFFSTDCAGTEELQFSKTFAPGPDWGTSFLTVPIKVDTIAPTINGPTFNPPGGTYLVGQSVAVTYSCSDFGSGVNTCSGPVASGANIDTSHVVTNQPFTVTATDIAGNSSNATLKYTVVNSPADLALAAGSLPPSTVKSGTYITYGVIATNFGPSSAQGVSITDSLPRGTTFSSGFILNGFNLANCTASAGVVTCPVGNLNKGGVVLAFITLKVPSTPATITNTIVIGGLNPDPKPGNNSFTVKTNVK